jgi:hypothetical protein
MASRCAMIEVGALTLHSGTRPNLQPAKFERRRAVKKEYVHETRTAAQ